MGQGGAEWDRVGQGGTGPGTSAYSGLGMTGETITSCVSLRDRPRNGSREDRVENEDRD